MTPSRNAKAQLDALLERLGEVGKECIERLASDLTSLLASKLDPWPHQTPAALEAARPFATSLLLLYAAAFAVYPRNYRLLAAYADSYRFLSRALSSDREWHRALQFSLPTTALLNKQRDESPSVLASPPDDVQEAVDQLMNSFNTMAVPLYLAGRPAALFSTVSTSLATAALFSGVSTASALADPSRVQLVRQLHAFLQEALYKKNSTK